MTEHLSLQEVLADLVDAAQAHDGFTYVETIADHVASLLVLASKADGCSIEEAFGCFKLSVAEAIQRKTGDNSELVEREGRAAFEIIDRCEREARGEG